MSDSQERIQNLETVVRALHREVIELRGEVARLGGAAPRETATVGRVGNDTVGARVEHPDVATPAARRGLAALLDPLPRGGPPPMKQGGSPPSAMRHQSSAAESVLARLSGGERGRDIEALVGRYGTMGIAALLILAGIGALLTWAAARGLFGPTMRVALGALVAAVVAAAGLWVRARRSRRFGDMLLALALAIIHVDAWGASQYLHIVPTAAALLVAAACSLALAALAFTDDEQALFNVGVGGALIAPFVTSSDSGNVHALMAYGWVVIGTSVAAIRARAWAIAPWLLVAGCAVYVAAALPMVTSPRTPWLRADAPAAFALLCGWSAFLWGGQTQRARASLPYIGIAVVALLVSTAARLGGMAAAPDVVTVAVVGAVSVYAMIALRGIARSLGFTAGVVLPLGFLAAGLAGLAEPLSGQGAALAGAWAAVAAFAAYTDGERREWHWMTAGFASMVAVLLPLSEQPAVRAAALAAHGVLAALVMRRERVVSLFAPIALALIGASGWAYELLAGRPDYRYTPLVGTASGVALIVVLAWTTVAWLAAHTEWERGARQAWQRTRTVAVVAAVVAFLWLREELARAWSPEVRTVALILYYAAAGVTTILVGRWRSLAEARRVGLALAIYASLLAFLRASTIALIGLKVGTYLVVGCFLLAVAYWYRAASEPAGARGSSPVPLLEPSEQIAGES